MDTKYRVTLMIEKYAGKSDTEIVTEMSISYDDYKTSNRLFVWLVQCLNQFKRENEYVQEKQSSLFDQKKNKSGK